MNTLPSPEQESRFTYRAQARDRAERMVDLLRDRGGLETGSDFLEVCGEQFVANVTEGAPDVPEAEPGGIIVSYPRFGAPRQNFDAPHTPWRQSPSTQEPTASQTPTVIETVELGAAINTSDAVFASAADRGTILHLAFRVLTNQPKPRSPELCPERLLFDVRNGTWLVETIRASGHVRRTNRPNTRLLPTKRRSQNRTCKKGAIHTGQMID